MTSIVYDGVGGGGALFEGIKFCFLQRVPSRVRWIELVQSNGGEVVILEKQADIVIADDARKDSPVGSTSWKYIEQSVKKGIAENKDDYPAGPAIDSVREVVSNQPAKHGRTAFTAEDDRILIKWVTTAEKAGHPSRGNELYKQLEKKYPHHTYQSWRDRWIKQLCGRPRPEVSDEEEEEAQIPKSTSASTASRKAQSNEANKPASPESSEPRPLVHRTGRLRGRKSKTEIVPEPNRSSSTSVEEPSPNFWFTKSAGGTSFSKQESKLLLDAYDQILEIDPDKEIDAWAAWSVTYPNHTPQEWRNYFVKKLAPIVATKRNSVLDKNYSGVETNLETSAGLSVPASETFSRLSNGAKINRNSNGSSSKPNPSKPTLVKDPEPEKPALSNDETIGQKPGDLTMNDENIFKEYLTELAEQLEVQIEFNPSICGKEVPLFQLWQVVRSDEFKGKDEVDGRGLWVAVAKRLNFTPFRQTRAAKELKACYEEILADLEEELQEFTEFPDLTDSQEQAELDAQLVDEAADMDANEDDLGRQEEEADDEDQEEDLDLPSSPVLPVYKKRNASDRIIDRPGDKRQRIDSSEGKKLEIPSTPEDIINSHQNKQRLQNHGDIQRIDNTATKAHVPSPLKNSPILGDELEQPDGNDFVRKLLNRPALSSPLSKVTIAGEPETQDFEFTKDGKDDGEGDGGNLASSPSLKPNGRSRSRDHLRWEMEREDSSSQLQTPSEVEAELGEYVDRCIALGYEETIVYEALVACSMQTRDALYVMEGLQSGKGIPEGMQGVWTFADDLALESGESLEYARILRKHGKRMIFLRREYFREREEARETLELRSRTRDS